MKRTLIKNVNIILPNKILENGMLLIENAVIKDFGLELQGLPEVDSTIDGKGAYLSPGFFDTHTHGAGGADFMDGSVEAIVQASRAHLAHGTTSICPTTLTCTDDELFTFIDHYKEAKTFKKDMPRLMGIHFEGPYFSPLQAGAQAPGLLINPTPQHYMKILERAGEDIARWSIAPELPGALKLGDELQRLGVLASIGHSNATYEEVVQAMDHGFKHLTHFYSGMSGLTRQDGYRILGVIQCGYLFDELHIEIIADGIHLPPELLRLILKLKDHNSITLITDSMRAAGMTEGESLLGSLAHGTKVIVEDGIAKLMDRSAFAGSVATTDRLVRVMTQKAGLSLVEAVKMLTLNPAKLMKVDNIIGSIENGKRADLLLFDEDIKMQMIFVDGEIINLEKLTTQKVS